MQSLKEPGKGKTETDGRKQSVTAKKTKKRPNKPDVAFEKRHGVSEERVR
jgi:hypothetical protein